VKECASCEDQTLATWFLTCRDKILKLKSAVHKKNNPPANDTSSPADTTNVGTNTTDDDDVEQIDEIAIDPDFQVALSNYNNNAEQYYFAFLQYLWLASKNKLPGVSFVASNSVQHKKKFDDIKASIEPPNLHQANTNVHQIQPPQPLDAEGIARAAGEGIGRSMPQSKKIPCFENLGTGPQAALLCLCSPDGLSLPSEMPHLALDFMRYSNIHEATAELQLTLASMGCSALITGFISTPLYRGRLSWPTPGFPSGGFSAFYLGRQAPVDDLFSTTDLEREVRMSSGDKMDRYEIKSFTDGKKIFSRPTNIDQAWQQIVNFQIISQFYLGSSALITTQLSTWVNHISLHQHVYASLHLANPRFATEVVFHIDNCVQQTVASCYRAQGTLENCDFSYVTNFNHAQQAILMRSFTCTIPSALFKAPNSNSKNENSSRPNKDKKKKANDNKDGRNPKSSKSRRVENPDKSLCLSSTEKFGDIFPGGNILFEELPYFNGNTSCQCCLRWHARGFCSEPDCERSCSHGKADAETKKKFLAFLSKQRAHVKSK
jgi:hypothetical protein